jgi:hypothetical protein
VYSEFIKKMEGQVVQADYGNNPENRAKMVNILNRTKQENPDAFKILGNILGMEQQIVVDIASGKKNPTVKEWLTLNIYFDVK